MQISEQYIESIHFDKLKNLKDLTLNFSDTRLTAIMGVNGAGKSTILHALACCYKPLVPLVILVIFVLAYALLLSHL